MFVLVLGPVLLNLLTLFARVSAIVNENLTTSPVAQGYEHAGRSLLELELSRAHTPRALHPL